MKVMVGERLEPCWIKLCIWDSDQAVDPRAVGGLVAMKPMNILTKITGH